MQGHAPGRQFARFKLHPLVLEDILNTDQRPKVEDYGDYLFLVAHFFSYDAASMTLSSDQVSMVIKKRSTAIRQLAEHLREGVAVARWLWVSSGDVYFADTERTRRRLDNAGIEFVGRRVLARHLEGLRPSGASMESLRKRNDSKGRR